MIKTLTQVDIVKYVYDETTIQQNQLILEAAVTNDAVADELIGISEAKELLDHCLYSTSPSTLNRILEYSKRMTSESAN